MWLGYWLAIFTVTHRPVPGGPGWQIPGADKIIHFLLYFVLVLLGGRYFRAVRPRPSVAQLLAWACAYAAYGAFDEWLQQFVDRSMSVFDWVADLLGIAAGTVLLLLKRRTATGAKERTGNTSP